MDLVELTKRKHRDLYDSCDKSALQKLARTLGRGKGLLALLKNNDAVLSPFTSEQLSILSNVHREFTSWKEAVKDLRRNLAKSQLVLPDGSMPMAATPHELSALERTARMCPRSGFQDHDSWAKAVSSHLELWKACVELGLARGSASVSMANLQHPEAEEFSSHVAAKMMLVDVRGYQWLGARRGEHAGALSISIQVATDDLEDQAKARLAFLGLAANKRGHKSVIQELVLDNIDSALRSILDKRAETEALKTAASAYVSLLTTPPIQSQKVMSVFVSTVTAPMGVAVLDKDGEVITQTEVANDAPVAEILKKIANDDAPDTVVLPVSSSDDKRLRECTEALADLPIARVLPAALREAKKNLSFTPTVASAVILGRRALKPRDEWNKIAPASLGLGEYSSDLPQEQVTEILAEARALTAWDRRSEKSAKDDDAQGSVVTFKRLNPLIRTVRDLKPGMSVDGVITNLTRFGAFVNIGLSTEAMIHVSQLSTEFVDEPSQVVRVGQNVTARIIDVVPEKSRIALSLKPALEEGERPRRESRPPTSPHGFNAVSVNLVQGPSPLNGNKSPLPPHRGRDKGSDKKSRTEALADLDALFKK